MSSTIVLLLSLLTAYVVGYVLSYRYWNKHMNDNNIALSSEEAGLVLLMMFLYFFFWDGIEVIMKHAKRKTSL